VVDATTSTAVQSCFFFHKKVLLSDTDFGLPLISEKRFSENIRFLKKIFKISSETQPLAVRYDPRSKNNFRSLVTTALDHLNMVPQKTQCRSSNYLSTHNNLLSGQVDGILN
jgi:hypothetical protein